VAGNHSIYASCQAGKSLQRPLKAIPQKSEEVVRQRSADREKNLATVKIRSDQRDVAAIAIMKHRAPAPVIIRRGEAVATRDEPGGQARRNGGFETKFQAGELNLLLLARFPFLQCSRRPILPAQLDDNASHRMRLRPVGEVEVLHQAQQVFLNAA